MRNSIPFLVLLGLILGSSAEAQVDETACTPNQAVYARADGKEFIVRHIGELDGQRYLEGIMGGEDVAFVLPTSSAEQGFGNFSSLSDDEYARRARYDIEWIDAPTASVSKSLTSTQEADWGGTWKLIRCDGKSGRAEAAIRGAKPIHCPADRLIFIDEESGRRFTAEQYSEASSHYGWMWLLRGKMDGSVVYLSFELTRGSLPCCFFLSYYPGEGALSQLQRQKPKRVKRAPIVTEANKEEYTVSGNHQVDKYMGISIRRGPMSGMRLVPIGCRR